MPEGNYFGPKLSETLNPQFHSTDLEPYASPSVSAETLNRDSPRKLLPRPQKYVE